MSATLKHNRKEKCYILFDSINNFVYKIKVHKNGRLKLIEEYCV